MPRSPHRTISHGIGIAWSEATSDRRQDRPIVVLHGLGSSSREFRELATPPDRRLVLVDLPGHGDSDKPDAWSYAIEAQADLVAAFVRQVAGTPSIVIGHSMGGTISIALAHRHPDLVDRLIVAEPNLDPGSGTLSGHIARQSEQRFVDRGYARLVYQTRRQAARGDIVAGRFLATLEQASPVALHRCAVSLRAERSPTFREQLESLPIPRALLWGEHTPPLAPPLADPAIAIETITGAGHVMMTEQPTAFATAIRRNLDDENRP